MNILGKILITIAVTSAMVTVASSTPNWTIKEATQYKIVFTWRWGRVANIDELYREMQSVGVKHCKKYGKVIGKNDTHMVAADWVYVTYPCVNKN